MAPQATLRLRTNRGEGVLRLPKPDTIALARFLGQ